MSALNIHLPAALQTRVQARAAESGFASVEEYVEALLLADAAGGPAVEGGDLEALLRDRGDGPFIDVDDADLRQMREKLKARLGGDDEGAGTPEPRA